MNELNHQSNFSLALEQELLLKAVLLNGDEVISAWEKWKLNVDFELIDPGSYRLLPLLYHNLSKHGIKDPLMDRLKGIYRRTWYENQILSHKAVNLLEFFQDAGIKTIVLKGIALIHLYYKDYGLRPMSDFDILVPTEQATEVIKLLRKLGWTSGYRSPETIIPFIHSCDFTDVTALHHLDLHWHLFIECCQPNDDDDFWNGAVETTIKDIPTCMLNPADQLLHTCVHGMKWSIIPPFRWVADAIMILNSTLTEIDWDRLIMQAQKRHLILPLRQGMEYLKNNFRGNIPTEILQRIQNLPVSKIEYIEHKYKIENQKKKLLGNIPTLWFDSLRLSGYSSLVHKLFGFLKYVQHFWDLKYLWQLPLYSLFLSARKIWTMVNIKND